MLFEPERHEVLKNSQWNENEARDAIERIATGVGRGLTSDGLWPVHPLDRNDMVDPVRTLYFGAAGVMWGLDYLHCAGASGPPPDFSESRPGLLEANRRAIRRVTQSTGSLLQGDAGSFCPSGSSRIPSGSPRIWPRSLRRTKGTRRLSSCGARPERCLPR